MDDKIAVDRRVEKLEKLADVLMTIAEKSSINRKDSLEIKNIAKEIINVASYGDWIFRGVPHEEVGVHVIGGPCPSCKHIKESGCFVRGFTNG